MIVSDVMTREVRTCRLNDTLSECARAMRDLNIGSLPVVDQNDCIAGIITDRDISVRAVAQGIDPNVARVGDFMTPNPITIDPDIDVNDAAEIMADNQVRRLPVVMDCRIVGIVSLGDLAVDLGEEELMGEVLEDISVPVR